MKSIGDRMRGGRTHNRKISKFGLEAKWRDICFFHTGGHRVVAGNRQHTQAVCGEQRAMRASLVLCSAVCGYAFEGKERRLL